MKSRELLMATAVLAVSFVSVNAFKVNPPSRLISEDGVIRSAYYDTLNILGTSNECSEFFGGPDKALDAFNDLIGKVRKEFFAPSIGIRMSGATTNVFSMKTRSKHRMFDKVSINTNGPFYRHRVAETQPSVLGIGRFQPNTREARVLMLLHELGHMVEADGKWLLPDDGRDAELSRINTRKVEDACGDQIRNMGKGDIVVDPVEGKQQNGQTTSVEGNPEHGR